MVSEPLFGLSRCLRPSFPLSRFPTWIRIHADVCHSGYHLPFLPLPHVIPFSRKSCKSFFVNSMGKLLVRGWSFPPSSGRFFSLSPNDLLILWPCIFRRPLPPCSDYLPRPSRSFLVFLPHLFSPPSTAAKKPDLKSTPLPSGALASNSNSSLSYLSLLFDSVPFSVFYLSPLHRFFSYGGYSP